MNVKSILPIVVLIVALLSKTSCTTASPKQALRTEIDSLSYATGYKIAHEHINDDYGIFWFSKRACPDITECSFDTIASSLRSAFNGQPRMDLRSANLKIHDFFDVQREGRPVNIDSLSVVFGVLFHWNKFRSELVQFEPNVDILIKGMYDGITSVADPLLDEKTVNSLFEEYYDVQLPMRNMAKTQQYHAEIERSTPGIQRTASGLLYRIDKQGNSGRFIPDTYIYKASYNATLPLGGLVSGLPSRSFDIGQPLYSISYHAFREALKLIGVGGKITIWTDTSVFNQNIFNNGTTPNMPVVCELELISATPSSMDK